MQFITVVGRVLLCSAWLCAGTSTEHHPETMVQKSPNGQGVMIQVIDMLGDNLFLDSGIHLLSSLPKYHPPSVHSMVFWQTYPWASFFRPSAPFHKPRLPVPSGLTCTVITSATATLPVLQSIRTYLRAYFGDPPHTPVLDMPESDLLGPRDVILCVREAGVIVGTIRYHCMGELRSQAAETIYLVDGFCIHPAWRKKGLGDFLLTELHAYVNDHNMPYSVFLKEGPPVSALHLPFYSSTYVYRDTGGMKNTTTRVHCLSMDTAHRLMDQWHSVQPQLFILRNRGANQHWRLYRRGIYYVLACIQDTFQRKDSRPMGWVTAWLESPFINDALRAEAAEQIAATNPFDSLWMNRLWVGDSTQWIHDGPFHWYMHQWTTDKTLGRSYCLMV